MSLLPFLLLASVMSSTRHTLPVLLRSNLLLYLSCMQINVSSAFQIVVGVWPVGGRRGTDADKANTHSRGRFWRHRKQAAGSQREAGRGVESSWWEREVRFDSSRILLFEVTFGDISSSCEKIRTLVTYLFPRCSDRRRHSHCVWPLLCLFVCLLSLQH